MTTKEKIAVMQAYEEGMAIERKHKGTEAWKGTPSPSWNWDRYEYRIKAEPKYRPYASAEECFKDVVKHGGWVISGGNQYRKITGIGYGCNPDIVKMNGCNWMKFGELMEAVWADDGTLCGIKEE